MTAATRLFLSCTSRPRLSSILRCVSATSASTTLHTTIPASHAIPPHTHTHVGLIRSVSCWNSARMPCMHECRGLSVTGWAMSGAWDATFVWLLFVWLQWIVCCEVGHRQLARTLSDATWRSRVTASACGYCTLTEKPVEAPRIWRPGPAARPTDRPEAVESGAETGAACIAAAFQRSWHA